MSLKLGLGFSEFILRMNKPPELTIYEFEDFRLDVEHLMLRRRHEELPLAPKGVEILLALIERRGQIVSKDELLAEVWPNAIVEESNLFLYLSIIRKTLGKQKNGMPWIETFRRRGYRFVGEVDRYVKGSGQDLWVLNGFVGNGRSSANLTPKAQVNKPSSETVGEPKAADTETPVKTKAQISVRMFAVASLVVCLAFALFVYWRYGNFHSTASSRANEISTTSLTNGVNIQGAAISRDGRTFVYVTYDDGYVRTFIQNVGQLEAAEILPATKTGIDLKAFSPDGSDLYYSSRNENESQDSLYRISSVGGPPKRILTGIFQFSAISFSPDGTEFVFTRHDAGTKVSTIRIAHTDGSGEREILSSDREWLMFPGWSPDGRTIAYARFRPYEKKRDQYASIEAISVDGGPPVNLLEEKLANCFRIEWTAKGDGIVFGGTKLGEYMTGRRDQVWFASVPNGRLTRISPEGSRYVFQGLTSNNEALIFSVNRTAQIWEMDANGDSHTAIRLTRGTTDGRTGVAPLPDGRIGYMLRNGDNWEIWTMNPNASGQRQIFNGNPIIEELRATPDGKFFLFNAEVNGNYQLFRINSDGSGLKQLTSGDDSFAGDSSVSADSGSVVYGRTTYFGDTSSSSLFSVPIDGGESVPVRGAPIGAFTPYVSHDGNHVSFVDASAYPSKIGLLRTSDGNVRFFTAVEYQQLNIGAIWTPNNESLAYVAEDGKAGNVWIQPIDGRRPYQLTDFTSGWIYRIAYSADGRRLYLSRGFAMNEALLLKGFTD